MATKSKSVPEGFSGITPYITVAGAAAALDFYREAFGAEETMRLMQPDGPLITSTTRGHGVSQGASGPSAFRP